PGRIILGVVQDALQEVFALRHRRPSAPAWREINPALVVARGRLVPSGGSPQTGSPAHAPSLARMQSCRSLQTSYTRQRTSFSGPFDDGRHGPRGARRSSRATVWEGCW